MLKRVVNASIPPTALHAPGSPDRWIDGPDDLVGATHLCPCLPPATTKLKLG